MTLTNKLAARLGPLADRLRDALDARLTKLNTPLVGYSGVGLVVSALTAPHVSLTVACWAAAHHYGHLAGPLGAAERALHGVVGALGAFGALLGRWKRFSDATGPLWPATPQNVTTAKSGANAAGSGNVQADFSRAIADALRPQADGGRSILLYVQVPPPPGVSTVSSITWRPATDDEIRAAFFGLEPEASKPGGDVPQPTQGPADATGGGA